jgi:hypothetical protein
MRTTEEVMIRELTDMELDAVCGGGKRHKKHSSKKSIKQKVDIDQTNVAVLNAALEIEQENEANVLLVAINA